jgi:hypothetical protein
MLVTRASAIASMRREVDVGVVPGARTCGEVALVASRAVAAAAFLHGQYLKI